MVFASLVVGVSTLIQVRRIGPIGGGAVLPMFTAAFSIPFLHRGGGGGRTGHPGGAGAYLGGYAARNIEMLFILRRVVTPIVGGTVMMILSITLASVVFDLLDRASIVEPKSATLTAFVTLVVIAALSLRRPGVLRLWGPLVGMVIGCVVAAVVGIYDFDRVVEAK